MIKDKTKKLESNILKFYLFQIFLGMYFYFPIIVLFWQNNGLSLTEIMLLQSAVAIFILVLEIPTGYFADAFGRKSALIGSFVVYIISFSVFYLSTDFWLFLIAFILYGIGEAFRSGTHKGMIMDYLKLNHWEDQKINYYGHTRSWSQKGSAISALIAGLIVFYSGSYQNIFLYSIIPYLFNLLLILSYPGELNRSSELKDPESRLRIGLTIQSFFKIIKPSISLNIDTSTFQLDVNVPAVFEKVNFCRYLSSSTLFATIKVFSFTNTYKDVSENPSCVVIVFPLSKSIQTRILLLLR